MSKIDTLKIMIEGAADPSEILALYYRKNKLNKEEVNELRQYMTKEIFSSSYMLGKSLVDTYPEYFDEEIWRKNPEKSISFISDIDMSPEEVYIALKLCNKDEITEEVARKVFEYNNESLNQVLLRKADLTDDFVKNNVNYLTSNFFKNPKVKESLSTQKLENILNSRSIDMKFFSAVIQAGIKDLGWCKRVLTSEWNFISSSNTFDNELIESLAALPETYVELLFKIINKYDPNALSYTVLSWLLNSKDMPEGFLIEYFYNFKTAGLYRVLANYAINHNYKTLVLLFGLI